MRTDVSITVDTEFSIAGAFGEPEKYIPLADEVVDCDGHGLPFLLDTFAEHDIPATFFVEALNHRYFGDGSMGKVVSRILKAGQDVQLHLHPTWLAYDHGHRTGEKSNDHCDGRRADELRDIISLGLDTFARWGAPRPIALRTGNLHVDRTVYQVMRELDIPAASNIGIGIFRPNDPSLCFHGGRHIIDGVMEVPLLSFRDFGPHEHYRPLQVTACSWAEIERILRTAHAHRVANVVILSHPFEYMKADNFRYEGMTRNRVVQNRLRQLCGFLADNRDYFRPVSFKDGVRDWLTAGEVDDPLISTPPHLTLMRMAENKFNDMVRWY